MILLMHLCCFYADELFFFFFFNANKDLDDVISRNAAEVLRGGGSGRNPRRVSRVTSEVGI